MRFEMNPETRQILDFLAGSPRKFTYGELQNLTQINDLSRLRGYLMTSLRRLRKQGIWYRSVRGVGYELVVDEDEKNPIQTGGLAGVRRKIKRVSKDQDLIHVEKLSRDGKMAFTFNSARIGRIMDATGRKVAKEIERKMANGQLPIKKKK